MVVISEIKNQWGELIPETCVDYCGNAIWEYRFLQCYSCADLGLGTCRCVTHSPYHTSPMSVREFVKLIEERPELVTQLSDEEKEVVREYKNDMAKRILYDVLGYFEMTEKELENAFSTCYKLGINPLPRLREVLRELGYDVEVVYCIASTSWGEPEPEEKPLFIVYHATEDGELWHEGEVWFDIKLPQE